MSSKTLGTGFLSLTCGRGSAGLRNLVVGGRRAISYTDSPTSPGWLHRRWQLSTLRPSSKREYCLGAWVEVTQGRPESISAILYDTSSGSGRWTHNEIRASYDYTQGGRQWLTWSFPLYASWPDGERLANQLLIYAGRAGHTQGIGITVSELCLLEGDVAPSSWIPAPEDVEADAMATARVQTITRHRDLVGIERDRLHEIYRKLRTDKRTPKDLGLRLEHLWISCSGAHAELDRACTAAIASPTDANNEAVNRLTGTYRAKVIDMQRGIQEAEEAIREGVYNQARGKTRVRVEGKGLDPNKYYPIIIKPRPNPAYPVYGVRLERGLYQRELGVPPYASHSYGFDLRLEWSFVASGWGAAAEDRKIYAYSVRHVRASEPPLVSRPKQEMRASWEYVYVRGGSDYYVEVTGATDLDIQLYPEGAYWEGSTGSQYSYRWEVLESIDALGEPKVDLDVLSDRLLAEIARERGELRQAIESARVATRADYEARVQDVLAQVSQLEGLMRDGQAVLQRQIDRQVERWYGSEIAQSGVPPTSLWAASDNAKHEGDTYTCVAPRGVTITPANAAQYPNVGKSWRWTNGGSGTAYGWELIADTDITQALALASRAQATADGKMTHYITPTPPVTYQQGDQWTLPAPWRGKLNGQPYTYSAGSILTATADSILGQHHPEHWQELVRYTDLTLDQIRAGASNLLLASGEAKTSNVYHLGTWQMSEDWQEDAEYTIAIWMRHNSAAAQEIYIYPNDGFSSLARVVAKPGGLQQVVLTYILPSRVIKPNKPRELRLYAMSNHPNRGGSVEYVIERIAVVRGNIPPQSWMPALEDIEAEIQARMREVQAQLADANRAISRAQGAADTAKRQADSAKSAAEANDGKIDEAEARGIAKTVSAYRQSLLTEWEALRSGYEALKTSEYLIDKQPLTSAYSTAKQRYDNLLAKITAILSDSKVSAQEYSQYTAAYEAYQPAARSLAQALEAAAKAMQDRLKQLAAEAAASAESRAKSHADTKASEAEQRAKTEARRAASEAERRAKEHAERQIAHMDYLKQVLKRGTTQIQGGAVLGQYIAVADLEQVVRGYISGMINGAFLAAGVSNHGTPQETRNVEISHDGDGHFGQLHFSGSGQDGRIDFVRHGATAPYLSVGGVLAPIEEVILDALLKDTYTSPQIDMDYYPLPLSGASKQIKTFSVLRDGASCRISGQLGITSLRFNGSGAGENRRVAVTTEIILQRQSTNWVDVAVIGSTWVGGLSNQDYWQEPAKVVDLQLPNLPKGQYRLVAQSKYTDNYYSLQVISQIRIMPLTILVERVSSVQQVAFTERGFRAFYGAERHVDIAAQGPHVLSVRGATDIPGVLAAGRVNARGQVLASWGARVKDRGTDNVRVSMISDNTYIVYHSIGHLDYVVQLTVQNSWNVASYYDITPWSFRVKMSYPGGSWGNAYAGEFSYVCIGTNG